MAITQVTVPDEPVLVYRPVVFRLDSDDGDILSIIVEVLVSDDAVTFTRIAAKSVSPDLGTTDEFTFDIQEELKTNVDFILKTLGSSSIINDNDKIFYKIKAYEVIDVSGLPVTSYDPDDANNSSFDFQSGVGAAFNWRESLYSLASFTKSDYNMTTSSSKFLTESPTTKDIELSQNEFLGMAWATSTGGVKNYKIEILTYNSSDALLNTDTYLVTDWDEFTVSHLVDPYLSVPVGTANLIAAGVSLTNVAYYTIQLINDDGDKSELRRFNIVSGCDTDLRIHFINKFGKQDSITLKGNQIEDFDTNSIIYEKALSNTYDSSAAGLSVIRNTLTRNYTAYSKSISRSVLEFANTMLVNKMAWIEVDSNYFPIIIEDGSKIRRNEQNMPIQFVLNFSLANKEKGLRG